MFELSAYETNNISIFQDGLAHSIPLSFSFVTEGEICDSEPNARTESTFEDLNKFHLVITKMTEA